MSKISFKPSTMLSPVPCVMIGCGTMESPNIVTVAWTGTISSDPATVYISLRKSRFSHELISQTGEFTINLISASLCKALDYCGVKSGRDTDKFRDCHLTAEKGGKVSAPCIMESPVTLECKVTEVKEMGSHDMFFAEIVSVNVDEKYIDDNERIRLDKAALVSYAHGQYFQLGKSLGHFGFSVKKPSTVKRQRQMKNNGGKRK